MISVKETKMSPGARLRHRARLRAALLFMFPGIALYTGLILLPSCSSLFYSLQDRTGRIATFVGFANFVELFHDKLVWVAVSNNLRVLAVAVLFQLPIALVLAYLLSRRPRVAGFFRFWYFVPSMVGAAVVALMWGFIYEKSGLLNAVLGSIGLESWIRPWLSQDGVVQWSVVIPRGCTGVGFYVIIFMAAISEIPDTIYEAAAMDGANSFRQFLHITLPSVLGIYLTMNILGVLEALSAFVFPFILTKCGPLHRTETLTSYAVWQAITNFRVGYGSAIAVFHFSIAATATLIIRRLTRAEREESKAL